MQTTALGLTIWLLSPVWELLLLPAQTAGLQPGLLLSLLSLAACMDRCRTTGYAGANSC